MKRGRKGFGSPLFGPKKGFGVELGAQGVRGEKMTPKLSLSPPCPRSCPGGAEGAPPGPVLKWGIPWDPKTEHPWEPQNREFQGIPNQRIPGNPEHLQRPQIGAFLGTPSILGDPKLRHLRGLKTGDPKSENPWESRTGSFQGMLNWNLRGSQTEPPFETPNQSIPRHPKHSWGPQIGESSGIPN